MIRPTSFGEIYRPAALNKSTQMNTVSKLSAVPTTPAASDRVQISAAASFQSVLTEAVHTIGHEISSAASPERLSELKQQMASGTYQPSSTALADSLLQRATPSWEV